jgi:radical SAM protein with 4Fe4S-binding SPASM domain
MPLECAVLGKDIEITDSVVPVISPNWRLKRSGDWSILLKYEAEQIAYLKLSPLMGATLALMDGKLSFRHLSLLVQYTHDFESLEKSQEFVEQVIRAANKDNDAVVRMETGLAPYIKKVDPLQFVEIPEDDAQRRPVTPLSLNLMFSNDCETNCSYCYAHRRSIARSEHLSAERWIGIFREAQAAGMEQLSLSGGDPLFRKDSLTLIAELIKLDLLFLLSTKCHITAEMADRLVEIGMTRPVNQYVREIQISMDGPDSETADLMAGSPGFLNRSIDSIKNLVGKGFNLRVKAVVTPLNAPRVYQWIKLVVGLGVNKVSVAAYSRTLYRHRDEHFLSREDRELITEQCQRARADFPGLELRMTGLDFAPEQDQPVSRMGDWSPSSPDETSEAIGLTSSTGSTEEKGASSSRLSTEAARLLGEKAAKWQERTHCSGGRSSMTITPDGKVVLCDTIPQEGIFLVGDVANQSIIEVWNSEELVNFAYPPRERFAGSACHDCEDLDSCQGKAGYCFRDSYFNYGTAFGPPPKCPRAPDDGMRMD